MLLHEGLKLIDPKSGMIKKLGTTYEKNYTDNKGTVIDLKSYKKDPPTIMMAIIIDTYPKTNNK